MYISARLRLPTRAQVCGKGPTRATGRAGTRVGGQEEAGAAPPPETPSEGRERQGRPVTRHLTLILWGVCPGDPLKEPEGPSTWGAAGPDVISAAASAKSRQCPDLSLSLRPTWRK